MAAKYIVKKNLPGIYYSFQMRIGMCFVSPSPALFVLGLIGLNPLPANDAGAANERNNFFLRRLARSHRASSRQKK